MNHLRKFIIILCICLVVISPVFAEPLPANVVVIYGNVFLSNGTPTTYNISVYGDGAGELPSTTTAVVGEVAGGFILDILIDILKLSITALIIKLSSKAIKWMRRKTGQKPRIPEEGDCKRFRCQRLPTLRCETLCEAYLKSTEGYRTDPRYYYKNEDIRLT